MLLDLSGQALHVNGAIVLRDFEDFDILLVLRGRGFPKSPLGFPGPQALQGAKHPSVLRRLHRPFNVHPNPEVRTVLGPLLLLSTPP